MKQLFFLLFLIISTDTFASAITQRNLDSISFESQRKRVNDLLDERSKRFGEYTTSLEQKTGVFGLFKTKNDMQKSIDILKSVVINDNSIFIETRKLINIKDSQAERFQKLASEYDQQVTAYMKTISKLQVENEQLRAKIDTLEKEEHKTNKYLYLGIVLLLIIGAAIVIYKRHNKQNVTKV